MPWAAGVYTRSNGFFTGPTVWAQDAAVPVNITTSRHDTHDQDIATGLNNCATIDGLNKFAATIAPGADATYSIGSTVSRWVNVYLSSSVYFYNGSTNAVQLNAGTLTASRAVLFPDAAGNVVIDSAAQTLTNKTFDSTSNVVISAAFAAAGGITLTGTNPLTSAGGTLTIGAGTGFVSSIADATNGGLSYSASAGVVTSAINVNDLVTKVTPVSGDFIAIYDTAGSASKKASPASILTAAAGVPISTQVVAGAGITGGGALSANVTLSTTQTTEATLASNTTCDLGSAASHVIAITGTSATTSFGSSANANDPIFFLRFEGATPFTYNATSMIIPGATNLTAVAGDEAIVKYEGSGNWRWIEYTSNNRPKPWPGGATIGTSGSTTSAISALALYDDGRIKGYTIISGLSGSGGGGGTCFPLDAFVTMADGSMKLLDKVRIGDQVRGAYGEANPVLALDRTTLGNRLMFWINREHWTSDEHPHMRPDRTFVCPNVNAIYAEWGAEHPVIVKSGKTEQRLNIGLPEGAVTQMRAGQMLLKSDGPVELRSFDIGDAKDWRPETPLGNLVLGGSGTYVVDGYVVTGWPDHTKFDHVKWEPKT